MPAPHSWFSIFRRGRPLADFGWLGIDLHNHILPGIDDGAPDVLTSTQMLTGLARLGFAGAFATPHVMAEVHPNTPDTINCAAARLNQALGGAYRQLLRGASAEYMLDERFGALLSAGDSSPLLPLPGRRLLVEWSLAGEPLGLADALAAVAEAGYRPVIAHPERRSSSTPPRGSPRMQQARRRRPDPHEEVVAHERRRSRGYVEGPRPEGVQRHLHRPQQPRQAQREQAGPPERTRDGPLVVRAVGLGREARGAHTQEAEVPVEEVEQHPPDPDGP